MNSSPYLVKTPTKRRGRPRIEEADIERAVKAVMAYSTTGNIRLAAASVGISKNTLKALLSRHPELACLARCSADLAWLRGYLEHG